MSNSKRDEVEAYLVKYPDAGANEIAAKLGVSWNTAHKHLTAIRDEAPAPKALPPAARVIDVEDETPPPLTPHVLRERNKELEEENEGLRILITELLEHINDLSTENMRQLRALRAAAEA